MDETDLASHIRNNLIYNREVPTMLVDNQNEEIVAHIVRTLFVPNKQGLVVILENGDEYTILISKTKEEAGTVTR